MIDESLLKSNFLGRDGFTWWIGRVADPGVWKKENIVMGQKESLGQRVKVRIIGYHPFSNELPEKDLPWAEVLMDPITGGGQGAMGDTMTLVGGETAVGFFMDGDEAQHPVIIGLLNRHNSVKHSINPEELKGNNTSGFKNFTGGNNNKLTKKKTEETKPLKPAEGNQPAQKGSVEPVNGTGSEVGQTEQGVIQPEGEGSVAAKVVEQQATKEQENPSNCGSDAIGRLTQALTDFIAFTNTLESSLGAFVDPISNLVVDMDAELKRIVRISKGIVKGIINNVRDGIFGKLNFIFSQFLGKLNLVNPLDFLTDEASKLALKGILDTLFCLFEKLIGDIGDFLLNMFSGLVDSVLSGPVCAAEQFVSGIFAKIFDLLESIMGPVLDGLEWLTGGIGSIQGFLRSASNLASQIFSFIGCDGRKCTTPSKWVSTVNGSLIQASDDWTKQVEGIDLLGGVAEDLEEFGKQAEEGIGDFFGSDEFENQEYKGMRIGDIMAATDKLTGGDSAGALNRGLGSIESAIAGISFFGGSEIFDACNQKYNNPQTQSDISPMPMGYVYDKCIPPEVNIFGNGSGATAVPIVNYERRILAVQITNPGSGYDSRTSAAVIDNTNNGTNARLQVLTKDGKVDKIVVLSGGRGYCPNDPSIGGGNTGGIDQDGVVGVVTGVYVERPGIGYTDGDTIIISPPSGDGIPVTPVVTPGNGSVIDVLFPYIPDEFDSIPDITINTRNGRGAKLIPIMEYKPRERTDTSGVKRSGLVGITSVIDCI